MPKVWLGPGFVPMTGGQEAEKRQEEAGAGRAVQRRRVGEAGDAAWDEVQMLRSLLESKDVLIQSKDDQLQCKDVMIQYKDVQLQSKDTLLQAHQSTIQYKDDQLQCRDALLQAHKTTIRLLHADIARLNAGCAAGGVARQPAPAPAAQRQTRQACFLRQRLPRDCKPNQPPT